MKIIRVTMPDNTEWDVSAETIAQHRAACLAHDELDQHGETNYDKVYDATMIETLANNELLIDWAVNNMSWHDVEDYAVPYVPEVDYCVGWVHGEKQVIERS